MIFIECNNDFTFFTLLCHPISKRKFRHFNKPELLKNLDDGDWDTVVGICDEDNPQSNPRLFPVLDKFEFVEALPGDSAKLFRHRTRRNCFLIMLVPMLEEWLYHRAKICGIDPSDFKLPRDPKVLHERFRVHDQPKFHEFLQKIIETDADIAKLRRWVQINER